ncbi:outer membrane efflux protein [Synechococcus sp. PCC 7335]|uniref:TolC family protein n=1 Tax=Synechococcus sp. (strain ATCC 29403 / PCC 7335) TaxID=91464 RepID=UPI00017EE826|nr:TolC family protein [Synechococcus sp. PCC 7335]EDX83522.1 outer membrane efflux protein [Synechococcus sp. PCC 7335]
MKRLKSTLLLLLISGLVSWLSEATIATSISKETTEEDLVSNPNPLSVPTLPEEVQLEQNPVITLEQAVQVAYQNNQALQVALLTLEQSEAAVQEARAALFPTVSTEANLINIQDSGSRTTADATVKIEYDILTSGSRRASIRVAELEREASALAVETQQEQIRLDTATAYYALQEAGENVRINQSFLTEAERNLRDSRLRQEVGVGTRFDTLRAEVQFANARQSLISSQAEVSIARRDIARLLNLPLRNGLTATPVAIAGTWSLALEESIILAFQNRAELAQQLIDVDIAEQQRRIALAGTRPQVSLFADYEISEVLEGATVLEDDFNDDFLIGIRFGMTLFDGGATRASARQREIAGAVREEQFSETLDQVRFEVEQAYFNLQSNQENIETSQVAVTQAADALALANLRLQAGVGT